MNGYSASAQAAVANPRTIAMFIAATTKQANIEGWAVGLEAAPADNTIIWELLRFTASGTATSVTVTLKDPGAPSNAATVEENATVEPTYTGGEIFRVGVNARSIYTRQYAPGRELRTNVTSDNGIGFRATHASATPTADVVIEWFE